ncbi:proline-tRNA ligase [Schizosaccharomyces cryophilus OY26]|uniref:Probable proline--tRNA ligase, mitochondrial n=1 Tax=Schizosaccharomyces cryophilus (strain OY26 / ATCC MYA-4695 / CBS 11777 / NBRC 106824 / NRRL Y48691) TaxID=653667 RepID=S9W4Q3_SCHCR|nr:proline-tRNA ligase [Schizosaccharomyces cryophilus OY26]EPY52890.1 proline-tRNA ligase [Schizosaccharomyces cryophilus OY26]
MLQFIRNRASVELLSRSFRKYNVPESSGQLLQDLGFVHMSMSGVFHLLPLGLRVQEKICRLIQQSMKSVGAAQVSLAHLSSKEVWDRSHRWETSGRELFRLSDRTERELCLAPTHEEDITQCIANLVESQKQLPIRVYQIGRKYRDEARPRGGLLRGKEFVMKDLYTFDIDADQAKETYRQVLSAYHQFFKAVGLPFSMVNADTGNIGGKLSHEFHYRSQAGEDTICVCPSCEFSTNSELLKEIQPETAHPCPKCGDELALSSSIEVGHAFLLGQVYSSKLGANVEVNQRLQPLYMGCYGIGVSRMIAAIANVTKDSKGLVWPTNVAPWKVLVVPTSFKNMQAAESVYDTVANVVGTDNILLEDRSNHSFGYKMKDAELIGYPFVVIVGSQFQEQKLCEVHVRATGGRHLLPVESLHQILLGNFL